jgi:hypothetical protein
LGHSLHWATSQSGRVASDMATLQSHVRSGRVERVRLDAIQLKRDALAFAQGSGRIGNIVNMYASSEARSRLGIYLTLVASSLSADWYEGKALARLADVIWRDPLGLTPATEEELASVQRKAERFAMRAVRATARAKAIRAKYRRLFRYVPVTPRANGK